MPKRVKSVQDEKMRGILLTGSTGNSELQLALGIVHCNYVQRKLFNRVQSQAHDIVQSQAHSWNDDEQSHHVEAIAIRLEAIAIRLEVPFDLGEF